MAYNRSYNRMQKLLQPPTAVEPWSLAKPSINLYHNHGWKSKIQESNKAVRTWNISQTLDAPMRSVSHWQKWCPRAPKNEHDTLGLILILYTEILYIMIYCAHIIYYAYIYILCIFQSSPSPLNACFLANVLAAVEAPAAPGSRQKPKPS